MQRPRSRGSGDFLLSRDGALSFSCSLYSADRDLNLCSLSMSAEECTKVERCRDESAREEPTTKHEILLLHVHLSVQQNFMRTSEPKPPQTNARSPAQPKTSPRSRQHAPINQNVKVSIIKGHDARLLFEPIDTCESLCENSRSRTAMSATARSRKDSEKTYFSPANSDCDSGSFDLLDLPTSSSRADRGANREFSAYVHTS